ncbi:hypothetical protein [Nannocystis pusilla]
MDSIKTIVSSTILSMPPGLKDSPGSAGGCSRTHCHSRWPSGV